MSTVFDVPVHWRRTDSPGETVCGRFVDTRDLRTGELLRSLTTTAFREFVTCGGCDAHV